MSNYYNRQWRLPNNENKDKQSNYSMDFTASDKISLGSSVDLGINSSISLWINMPNTPTIYIPLGEDSYLADYLMYISSTLIYIVIGNVYKTYTHSFNTNEWYHIVIVRQGDSIEVFKNNTSLGTQTGFGTSVTTKIDTIGAKTNGNNPFIGLMDGVCFFDYALTDGTGGTVNQIAALYGSSSTGIGNPMTLNPKPVAYYPLGDQDSFNGSNYLVPNSSLKDYVFSFDGLAEITTNGISGISSNTTVSFWFNNSTAASGQAPIIASLNYTSTTYENFAFRLQTNNIIQVVLVKSGNYEVLQTSAIIDNAWYFVALTTSTSGSSVTATLYLNGTQVATNSGTDFSNLNDLQNGLTIGHWTATGNQNNFNGTLSNIQIFNTALPATGSNSVETLYNNGSPLTSMSGYSSLQAWYKLDASELYSDIWSVENNASPTTFKSALNFDGTNDYIETTSHPMDFTTGDFTCSAWINVANDSNHQGIFGIRNSGATSLQFYVRNTNKLYSYNGSNDVFSTSTITNDVWNHVVLVQNGSNKEFYINGVLDNTVAQGNGSTSAATFKIGYTGYGAEYLNGSISNVAIYNTALSASNITTLYNNGVPQATIYGSPVAHWKLDNTTTGIQDSAGSNNGTNNGATEVATYVNTTAGTSSGMTQANLVQSDLSFTSGYSPYALSFDSASSDYIDSNFSLTTGQTQFSASIWVKFTGSLGSDESLIANESSYAGDGFAIFKNTSNQIVFKCESQTAIGTTTISLNKWYLATATYNAGAMILYVNGQQEATQTTATSITQPSTPKTRLGKYITGNAIPFTGELSNASVWNTALTATQVTEIYSEGVPSNLNNHSAYSNLVSWWQLGSNSSFNTNWTVLDEKGSNNGVSSGMTEDSIVDGVGSSANGLSSGMGGDEVIGDAPYSTANALSVNMDVEDRVSDTPS